MNKKKTIKWKDKGERGNNWDIPIGVKPKVGERRTERLWRGGLYRGEEVGFLVNICILLRSGWRVNGKSSDDS